MRRFYLSSQESDKLTTKTQIYSLAEKHGLTINIKKVNSSVNSAHQVTSVSRLDKIFAKIAENIGHSTTKKITFESSKKVKKVEGIKLKHGFHVKTNMYGDPPPRPSPLEPISPGEFNGSDWFFNLTWLNCSVTWDDDLEDISVDSYFSGSSVYSYEQINAYKTISGDEITFHITGKAYVDTPIGHVDAETVKSEGTFNARTATGTFTVTTSGY